MASFEPGAMRQYWELLYPFERIVRWLCYGDPKRIRGVEFAIYRQEDDTPLRYHFFETAGMLRKEVLAKDAPKIDIGAYYKPMRFARRADSSMVGPPRERELIFDIDLNDYDAVRSCCQGPAVCRECWKLIVVAVRVVVPALREHFGFRNILCVFSGRRGVHIWVCDERARQLSDKGRAAVLGYLDVFRGSPGPKGTDDSPENMHPLLQEAAQVLYPYCKRRLVEIKRLCDFSAYEAFRQFYPRFDRNVTIGMGHLLKAPFCVHPGTGKVCVPLTVDTVAAFDPQNAPTVDSVLRQVNEAYIAAEKARESFEDALGLSHYKNTDLLPYMRIFDEFLRGLSAGSVTAAHGPPPPSLEPPRVAVKRSGEVVTMQAERRRREDFNDDTDDEAGSQEGVDAIDLDALHV